MNIILSIVIPFKGKTEYIERLLESINQALFEIKNEDINKQIEIIIVSSEQKLNLKFPKLNIKIINCCEKTKVGEARNIGVDFSQGLYTYFIDSDCVIPSTLFKNLLNHIKGSLKNERVAGIGGPVLGSGNNTIWEKYYNCSIFSPFPTSMKEIKMTYLNLLFHHHPVTANLVLKTSLIRDNKFQQGVGEDVDIILRILKQGYEIIYDPRMAVLHNHRMNFKDFVKHFFKITSYYPKFIVDHRVNPILLRRFFCLMPYLALLFSTSISLVVPAMLIILPLISLLPIYLYYLIKTKDPKTSWIIIVLDIFTQFIIAPISSFWRLIKSE